MDRGAGLRSDQRKAFAASSKHSFRCRLLNALPSTRSVCVSFTRRSATGSILSSYASSSTALSSANMYGNSGGERMNDGVWRSALIKVTRVAMAP